MPDWRQLPACNLRVNTGPQQTHREPTTRPAMIDTGRIANQVPTIREIEQVRWSVR